MEEIRNATYDGEVYSEYLWLNPKAVDPSISVAERSVQRDGWTVESVLRQAGLEEYADKFETWEELMNMSSREMKEAGIDTRARKRILRVVEHYRARLGVFALKK